MVAAAALATTSPPMIPPPMRTGRDQRLIRTSAPSSYSYRLHAADECVQARVPAQRLEQRVHVQIEEPPTAILQRALRPVQRAVDVAQSDEDRGECHGGDVVVGRDGRRQI